MLPLSNYSFNYSPVESSCRQYSHVFVLFSPTSALRAYLRLHKCVFFDIHVRSQYLSSCFQLALCYISWQVTATSCQSAEKCEAVGSRVRPTTLRVGCTRYKQNGDRLVTTFLQATTSGPKLHRVPLRFNTDSLARENTAQEVQCDYCST